MTCSSTVVAVGRRILPKTLDSEMAEACLKLISGRRHKVLTSFALYTPNNALKVKTVKSIIKKDGILGLFGRGLQTRIITNGIQGMLFTVCWKYIEESFPMFKK